MLFFFSEFLGNILHEYDFDVNKTFTCRLKMLNNLGFDQEYIFDGANVVISESDAFDSSQKSEYK